MHLLLLPPPPPPPFYRMVWPSLELLFQQLPAGLRDRGGSTAQWLSPRLYLWKVPRWEIYPSRYRITDDRAGKER